VLIIYYSLVGNLNAVVTTAKTGLVVLALVALYFVYQSHGVFLLPQSTKTRFFMSYGGSALALLIILGLASYQRQDNAQKSGEPRSAPKAPPMSQGEPALETEIPIERTGQLKREPTGVSTSVSQIEAGQILLEYDEQVRAAFASLKGLPEAIKNQFLIEIGENPMAQVADVKKKVLLTALGRPDLTWNQEFEDLIENCDGANPDDVDELFRVFPVLSKRMSPAQVFNKVIGGDREEFHVIKADGRPTAILRRSDGKFLMESSIGRRTFSSDQEVYEYLGTPKDKRNSLPR